MQENGGLRGFFVLFATALGAIGVLIAIVSSFPPAEAVALGTAVVGAAVFVARVIDGWPLAPWRDRTSVIGFAMVGLGAFFFAVMAVAGSSGSESSSADPWGPNITPTTDAAFTGVIRGGAAMARVGPGYQPESEEIFQSDEPVAFEGFCLSPSLTDSNSMDRRWYIITGSQMIVPAESVKGHPPAESVPQVCGAEGTGPPEVALELKIGPEYEFIEGDKDPRQPNSAFSPALGAIGRAATEVGFAALTESDQWVALGLDYKPATPSTFALVLPSGLNRPGVDREHPIKVLAVICYAPRVPAPWATVGEVKLNGLRPPVLLGQRTLRPGSATTARKTACSRLPSGAVG
jgi:hypothetical protein